MVTKRLFGQMLVLSLVLGSQWLFAEEPKHRQVSPGLIGTWKLITFEDRDTEDQPWTYPFGESPKGYIVYDSTGHVFVQVMKVPPPKAFASGDDAKPTPDEAMAAYQGFVGYFGMYSVDDAKGVVTHHVEGSLDPSYVGTNQERPFQLMEDRLVIGDQKTWRRVLERVK